MFIKLTKVGTPVETIYIRAETILSVEERGTNETYNRYTREYEVISATIIRMNHYDSFVVVETIEVVMALILETQIVTGAKL